MAGIEDRLVSARHTITISLVISFLYTIAIPIFFITVLGPLGDSSDFHPFSKADAIARARICAFGISVSMIFATIGTVLPDHPALAMLLAVVGCLHYHRPSQFVGIDILCATAS